MTSCASKTEFGQCVGINDKKDPTLEYKYSTRNIVIGTIFFEMLFPPFIIAFNELECPVGKK
jgi:hypothetical protein